MKHTESIEAPILTVRGQRVMLDADLARLYGTTTKALNQAVKRNAERFPVDFAFQLTAAEIRSLRSQIVTVNLQFTDIKGMCTGIAGRILPAHGPAAGTALRRRNDGVV